MQTVELQPGLAFPIAPASEGSLAHTGAIGKPKPGCSSTFGKEEEGGIDFGLTSEGRRAVELQPTASTPIAPASE